MRVLTVGNMYPPHHRGGYEIVWQDAVRYLRRSGHEVRVLTTDYRSPSHDAAHEEDPDVHRELDWYWRAGEWRDLSMTARLGLERHNARAFDRHRRAFAPDVVTWWAMGGMSLSLIEGHRRLKGRSAFAVCDDWLLYGPDVDGWLRATRRVPVPSKLIEILARVPARVDLESAGPWLFPSQTVRKRAESAGWSFPSASVCHQGVPRRLFPTAPEVEWRNQILYVGRLDERKGVDIAIDAISELSDETSLRIIGTGDAEFKRCLRDQVLRLGLSNQVVFAEASRKDLHHEYSRADVVVFPVRWQEPWGLVPLEAMSTGTPVIATARGGSGEYLRDEANCLVFDPADGGRALATAIRRLAQDSRLRSDLRSGGLETVSAIGENDFNEAVEKLIEQAGA